MRAVPSLLACAMLVTGARVPATAQPESRPENEIPLRPTKRAREIVVEIPGERDTRNKVVLAGLATAAVIGSAFAVYFHLDSRSTAAEVSANDATGLAWTSERAKTVEQNERSQQRAVVGYAIGGGFLVALVVVYIATDPESETRVIQTTTGMRPIVEPTPGGATVGAAWSF